MSQVQNPQPQIVYVQPPPRGISITSFVLGLVSFFFGFVFVLPIIGVIIGAAGLKREPAGRGFAIAGLWINALIIAFWTILVLLLLAGTITAGFVAIPFLTN